MSYSPHKSNPQVLKPPSLSKNRLSSLTISKDMPHSEKTVSSSNIIGSKTPAFALRKLYWLLKTEPASFSIDDLKRVNFEHWDGVRNYQARNNLKAMKKGDQALFYHSRAQPAGIVGLAEIVKEAYPDFTALDPDNDHYDPRSKPDKPTWFMVDVKFVEKFPAMLTLDQIKNHPVLSSMVVAKAGRLSVQPVGKSHFDLAVNLARRSFAKLV